MSALGSPQFAAPEIRNKVTANTSQHKKRKEGDKDDDNDVTHTISSFVSEYGLLVDAYSLGCTIRYMMTGVQPHQSVAEAMANQSSMVEQLCGFLCVPQQKNKKKDGISASPTRKPRFRFVEDLPGEVQRLISKMTEREESKRTSVRAARRYHWINDVLPKDEDHQEGTQRIVDAKAIQYLGFVMHHKNKQHPVPTTAVVDETNGSNKGVGGTPSSSTPPAEQALEVAGVAVIDQQ